MNRIFLLIIMTFFLMGCSAVPKASSDLDSNAKNLSPTEEDALVYILRPALMGTMVTLNVEANGKHIGTTGSKRFLYTFLSPGSYVFSSMAENRAELPIVLEAGKTYFLEQKLQTGIFSARNKLTLMNDKDGRFKLQRCFLSKKNAYNQFR